VLKGRWSVHLKYGRQFEVKEYKTVLPATEADIHFGKEALRIAVKNDKQQLRYSRLATRLAEPDTLGNKTGTS
jgi:ATP-dependent exoDNAse (exonuclease V) alpha subunit